MELEEAEVSGEEDMFGRDGSGMRGRNVEDISELEEKGLLRRRDSPDGQESRENVKEGMGSPRRRVVLQPRARGEKSSQASFEKIVLDEREDHGASQGLSSKRDKQAFALLILLCESARRHFCPYAIS